VTDITKLKTRAVKSEPEAGYYYLKQSMDEAFPDIDPGVAPVGSRVVVQMRNPARKTEAGIVLTHMDVETEHDNTQTAKVRAVGDVAFCSRNDGKPWPEGRWAEVGDFVRVPKYATEQWRRRMPDGTPITFAMIDDLQIIGKLTIDPVDDRAFF
jgi:co-chaperonin GroES (HSP10)